MRWPYLIFIIIVPYYAITVFRQGHVERKDYAVLICGAFLLVWAILSLQRRLMIIDDHGITSRKIFKEIFIAWSEIKSVDIVVKTHGQGLSLSWKFERFDKPTYEMDFSYGKSKMQILADAIVTKCSAANVSDKVKRFAKDKNTSLLLT
jgi:hypothetical protein